VREDIEQFAIHIFGWIYEMKSRDIVNEESLSELLEAIAWTTTLAFDLYFSRKLMSIYNTNWK
jgi:hypothetical protein